MEKNPQHNYSKPLTRNKLSDAMEEGIIDPTGLAKRLMTYMSEDELKEFSDTEGYTALIALSGGKKSPE